MPIVGTAGHVDHGKSTLIQALTGRDPDRWDEEKRRGLTIDLGFAWTELDDGVEVGFVDVPGHERFIKNMLAGVGAVDVALFVVAADEGWMPQSEEHLAILDLLDVRHGVIALSRADLVDGDLLELAELEVRERLEGTSLADAPIIPTAAPTGAGIAAVRSALVEALSAAPIRYTGRPRLWIDRVFTIGGAGTVVTGTLLDGPISVGDTLSVYPGGTNVRVRGLQSHEADVDTASPGSRTALNLVGLDREDAERGSMIGRPGDWRPTSRILAEIRTVRGSDEPLRSRGAYRLHVGSGSWPARLRVLDGSELTGIGLGLIEPDGLVPVRVGDRFILRDVGRRAVVAGGTVLDPHPPRKGQALRRAGTVLGDSRRNADEIATSLLAVRGIARADELAADSGGGNATGALAAGDLVIDPERASTIADQAEALTRSHHDRHPLREGIPKPELASSLDVDPGVLEAIIDTSAALTDAGAHVRASDFSTGLDADGEKAWDAAKRTLEAAGVAVPRRDELGLDREQLHALVREGRLVEVSDDLVYLPDTLEAIEASVRGMGDGFTVAEFRDRLEISRKYAVPLLEWLDRRGVTRREGDRRVVR